MATKDRMHRREPKKAPAEIPAVPDLGRLKMPRKNNAAAAKEVASGNVFWDRRHVARSEQKKALRRAEVIESRRRYKRLEKSVRVEMLQWAPSWSWSTVSKCFYIDAEKVTQFQAEEMAEAISTAFNDAEPTQLNVRGIDQHQLDALRAVTHPKHRLISR